MIRSDLEQLESEALFVFREVVAQLERPVLLFSGGKDSILLAHLAARAFHPAPIPFPLLHIDTGHNFPETLEFRDRFVQKLGLELLVRRVEDSIAQGRVTEEGGDRPSRNAAQSVTLLDALKEFGFQAAFGGGRRDEEKARAKERFFSHRDRQGRWDPRNQRPELWNLYNARHAEGEHFRVFPLSNWTELDVWRYLERKGIEVPGLYFSHLREVIQTQGTWLTHCHWVRPLPGEKVEQRRVRFRTIGDMTCTGATLSEAGTMAEILAEVSTASVAERGGRADDRRSSCAMEDRKRQGYF